MNFISINIIFFLFYFFLGTSDVSRGTVLQGTFVWDPGIISEVFSMMLLGLRFDDYRKLKTVGCASIQREDWNRLHVTFVDHGLHPTFLKALDLAWDFVWRRGEDEVGCWTRLFLLSDGFWQQRPKKNHVGDSDHGSMLFVDGLNGLVLCYAMVSKLKDKKNNIDGNKKKHNKTYSMLVVLPHSEDKQLLDRALLSPQTFVVH